MNAASTLSCFVRSLFSVLLCPARGTGGGTYGEFNLRVQPQDMIDDGAFAAARRGRKDENFTAQRDLVFVQ